MRFNYQATTDDTLIMMQLNQLLMKGFKAFSSKSKEDKKNPSKFESEMLAKGWHAIKFGTLIAFWAGNNSNNIIRFWINGNVFEVELADDIWNK